MSAAHTNGASTQPSPSSLSVSIWENAENMGKGSTRQILKWQPHAMDQTSTSIEALPIYRPLDVEHDSHLNVFRNEAVIKATESVGA